MLHVVWLEGDQVLRNCHQLSVCTLAGRRDCSIHLIPGQELCHITPHSRHFTRTASAQDEREVRPSNRELGQLLVRARAETLSHGEVHLSDRRSTDTDENIVWSKLPHVLWLYLQHTVSVSIFGDEGGLVS